MSARSKKQDSGDNRTSWSDLERPPTGDVRESDTESAWAEFNALSQPTTFQQTQPASIPMPLPDGDPRYAPTVPGALLRPTVPAPLAPSVHHVTIEQAMAEARRSNRICPQPREWQQLYEMLPGKKQMTRGWEPQAPLTGSAWNVSNAMTKRMCLRDHLEWAANKGCLDEVFAFLKSLPEESWHHAGD
jgi:hypothetical protein